MDVTDYQSILAEPFEMVGAIGQALSDANNQSNR